MKKKIYLNMVLLSFLSVLLVSLCLSVLFYAKTVSEIKNEIKNKCIMLSDTLDEDDYPSLKKINNDIRVTVVEPDGTVSYDNTADINNMENHKDRKEISEAIGNGTGESNRQSETLGNETYYYAMKMPDGNIIRTAKTTNNIYIVFLSTLPVTVVIVLFILIVCHFFARGLTRKIIAPLEGIDFDKGVIVYDELSPFYSKINTQKTQMAQQLSEIETRSDMINAINESMKEGLILLDSGSRILSANKSVLDIFNKPDDMSGKNIIELTRNVDLLDKIRNALSGKKDDTIFEADGVIYSVFFSSIKNSGALILFMDITERANAEKLRREFSANVSHELKTPLTTISGYAELMANGDVDSSDINGIAGKIKGEARRLIALIEDIIMLSEIDEASDKKSFETFDLTEVIGEVFESLKIKTEESNIILELPKSQKVITANRRMMFEMLYNLIENGIKYNKPGGKVIVSVVDKNGKVKISVSDTGIGIEKQHHDRIFERFYRADKSRSKKSGGTGLGLSIVKHITAYHGGKVELKSEVGKGTAVIVEIES